MFSNNNLVDEKWLLAIIAIGTESSGPFSMVSKIVSFFALIFASINIFGGFLVTQRMLSMYKKKGKKND